MLNKLFYLVYLFFITICSLFFVGKYMGEKRIIFMHSIIDKYISENGRIPRNLKSVSQIFDKNEMLESSCEFWDSDIPGLGICFYTPWEQEYYIQIDSILVTLVYSSKTCEILYFDPGL